MQNNAAAIEVLLANGADVDARDRHLMTPLHWAVRGHYPQRTEALAVLIAAGADVGATDINGMTPLHHASQRARSEMARTLLEAGAPMGPDKRGRTPLILACGRRRHRADTVNTLIEFGADVNQNSGRNTPLSLAARHGHHGSVTALIRAGANVTAGISPTAYGPFRSSCPYPQPPVPYEIVLPPTPESENLDSPLHVACAHNKPVCAELLIHAGVSATSLDLNGVTPLYCACQHPNTEKLLKVLIEAGADVNGRECFYLVSPLTRLVEHCARPWIPFDCTGEAAVSYLISAGADVGHTDLCGNTALHNACKNIAPEIVCMLLAAGADVNRANAWGDTALHCVCNALWRSCASRPNLSIVRALLQAGADVDCVDARGKTALHIACEKGCTKIVRALLKAGADVDCVDARGKTALHIACEKSCVKIVRALLKAGACPWVQDMDKNSPASLTIDPKIQAMFKPRVKNAAG